MDRRTVIFGLFAVVGVGLVALVGSSIASDSLFGGETAVGGGTGHTARVTEQSVVIRNVSVDETDEGWQHAVTVSNEVPDRVDDGGIGAPNVTVLGFNASGHRVCEGTVGSRLAADGTATTEFSCSAVPMVLETRINGSDCYTNYPANVVVQTQTWGYLGANATGHHWTTFDPMGCSSFLPRDEVLKQVGCRQRLANTTVSAIQSDPFWLGPAYSTPVTNHTYHLSVRPAAAAPDTTQDVSAATAENGSALAALTPSGSQNRSTTVSAWTWYALVQEFEGSDARLFEDLPPASESHVTVENTVRRSCSLSLSETYDRKPYFDSETEYTGQRSVQLQYRLGDGSGRVVTLVQNISYSTAQPYDGHQHIYARSINESRIIERRFVDSPTLWTRVRVDGVDRGPDGIRYTEVRTLPNRLRRVLVQADRNQSIQSAVYIQDDWPSIIESLDDKGVYEGWSGYYPCGAGFVECLTNEHSLILKREVYFVVDYRGDLYYVELVRDPHARDDDATAWEG